MQNQDFMRAKAQAYNEMRNMNARSKFPQQNKTKEPPKPAEPPKEKPKEKPPENSPLGSLLPFLNGINIDGDTALIIGLILILMKEKTDKLLLYALIYILI